MMKAATVAIPIRFVERRKNGFNLVRFGKFIVEKDITFKNLMMQNYLRCMQATIRYYYN